MSALLAYLRKEILDPRIGERCATELLGIKTVLAFLRVILRAWQRIFKTFCAENIAKSILVKCVRCFNTYHIAEFLLGESVLKRLTGKILDVLSLFGWVRSCEPTHDSILYFSLGVFQ